MAISPRLATSTLENMARRLSSAGRPLLSVRWPGGPGFVSAACRRTPGRAPPRRCSRRGRCPRARCSRARRRRRSRRPRRRRTGPGGAPSAREHLASRGRSRGRRASCGSGCSGVRRSAGRAPGPGCWCGLATRMSLSLRERRALRIAISCTSLENALSSSRSRATICALDLGRRRAAARARCVFIPSTSSLEVLGDDEVLAVLLERLHRTGRALGQPALEQELEVLAGDVGVLLGARQRELLLDDRLGEDEPRVVVAGREDRASSCRGCRSRGSRHAGSRRAGGVEPQRRRAGDDPDRVVGPDRVPVVDALGVVPTSGRG